MLRILIFLPVILLSFGQIIADEFGVGDADELVRKGLQLGDPIVGGSGCPAGTSAAVLSPDATQLSILFDEYIVEVGSNNKKINRKSCNFAIPVLIPAGYSVSVFKVDYRGYMYIPRGGMGRFSAEYFFVGRRGMKVNKSFRGGTDDEFLIDNNVAISAQNWSICGKDTIIRVNSSILLKTNNNYEDAFASIDSADIDSGVVFSLNWKKCD